ncbi:MAG: hypothetical protein HOL27_03735 [Candidatus Marinimicrobia bacterium]|jgi:hypothetical protein|nr:hypothetical protein [Candidatus Neomarinimicrobiota bacterium]MBT3731583.1 hypothetical protein [Candidatus Neomarinimicrobiota bacterium]MBT4145152.1 hypothetical protein [Candidatus Neomarinimicrobiota bacterium]MBT5356498.1 hypothetical protein [Candidatus Neomarinimicrobiota bacterium]MBT5405048.1 hypothetical protein [Candidatus Neomarinimicrobiota bacterium]
MKKMVKNSAIIFLLFVFMTSCASKASYLIIDKNIKLHEYNSDHVKDLAYLEVGTVTKLYCITHSELENIIVRNYHKDGHQKTNLEISDPYPIQDTPQQDTFNSQRN